MRGKSEKNQHVSGDEKKICARITDCRFFRKYQDTVEFRMKGYQQFYCHGHLMEACARLRYSQANSSEAQENMAPTGIFLTD